MGKAMAKVPSSLTGEDYRRGALERLADAWILYRAEQFAGCASEAGRGVEGMLRAVIFKRDQDVRKGRKTLDTGHDLRQLLTRVRDLGLLPTTPTPAPSDLDDRVQQIARLWFNNMRFASTKFVETRWFNLGEVRRGRTMKQATAGFYDDCEEVLKRCEILCQRTS